MKPIFRILLTLSIIFIGSILSKQAQALTEISSPTNSSDIANNDFLEFTDDVALEVNADKTVTSISTDTDGNGLITFSTADGNDLSVITDIGSTDAKINQIIFSNTGILDVKGDIHTTNGISSDTEFRPSKILSLSGTSTQTIDSTINDAATLEDGPVSIDISNATTVIFDKDAFTRSLSLNSTVNLIANSTLRAVLLNVNEDATISGGANANIQFDQILFDQNNKSLTVDSDISLQTLTFDRSPNSQLIINNGSTLSITRDASEFCDFGNSSIGPCGEDGALVPAEPSAIIKGAGKVSVIGTVDQRFDVKLGESSASRLGELEINKSSGSFSLNGNNSHHLNRLNILSADSFNVEGTINANSTIINQSLTFNSQGGASTLGDLTIGSGVALTIDSTNNNKITLGNITMGNSATNMSIDNGEISGNVTGGGLIAGDVLLFSGTANQTIDARIGTSSAFFGNVNITNINDVNFVQDAHISNLSLNALSGSITADGLLRATNISVNGDYIINAADSLDIGTVTFNNDKDLLINASSASADEIIFSSDSEGSVLSLSEETNLNVSGNIDADLNEGLITGLTSAAGKIILSGNSAQTIDPRILDIGELELNNSQGDVALTNSANHSVGTLTISRASNLSIASTLTADITNINADLTFKAEGTTSSLGDVTIANGSDLVIDSNLSGRKVKIDDLVIDNSSTIIDIINSNLIEVSGDIIGNGFISDGPTADDGQITFTGVEDQEINARIGGTSIRNGTEVFEFLDTIEITQSNESTATFNEDVFVSTILFNNTNGKQGIAVKGDKTFFASNSIDLRNVNLTFKAGEESLSKIESNSQISFNSASDVFIDYSQNGTLGEAQTIIESRNGLIGSTLGLLSDNSLLFNPDLVINSNNVTVEAKTDTTQLNEENLGEDTFEFVNLVINNEQIRPGLIAVGTKEELEDSLASLKPVNNAVIVSSAYETANSALSVANQRMNSMNLTGGFASNKEEYRFRRVAQVQNPYDTRKKASDFGRGAYQFSNPDLSKALWGQVYGGSAKQDRIEAEDASKTDVEGYTASMSGLAFGVDTLLGEGDTNSIIGAAVSYTRTETDSDSDLGGKSDINSYQLTVYNDNRGDKHRGFYNRNLISAALNQIVTTRDIRVGTFTRESFESKYNADSFSAKTTFGYDAPIARNAIFSPHVSVQYFHLTQDDYIETMGGDDFMKVENEDFSNVITQVGFDILGRQKLINGGIMVPRFGFAWERHLEPIEQESTISFRDGTEFNDGFAVKTSGLDQDRLNFGAEVGIFHDSASFRLKYDLQISKDFTRHIAGIEFRKAF
ncbi:MAG: autotransporter domain-containing protein [Proteobacteria bacterium]|nr:autotransporter domain-containing protein [Pseudomonadota bacterium]